MPSSSNTIPYTNHNTLADSIVLKPESRTTFLNLLEAHLQKLQPADPVEAAVVEEMVADFWRMSRRYTKDLVHLDSTADTRIAAPSAAAENRLLLRRKFNRSLMKLQMLRSSHPNNQPHPDPQRRRPNEPTLLLKPVSTEYRTSRMLTIFPEVLTIAKRT